MKNLLIVVLCIVVQFSEQTPRNVFNNKSEETSDSKIVINVEYTNYQRKLNEVSNSTSDGKKLISETENIVEQIFVATVDPNESTYPENDGSESTTVSATETTPSAQEMFRAEELEVAAENTEEAVNKTCSEHENYMDCGPRCYQTCTFQTVNIRASRAVCESGCHPGCYCNSGYVRFNGRCVLPEDCPTRLCRLNEEYTECGTPCPISCDSHKRQNEIEAGCPEICVPGCFCKDGYVKNYLGLCILPTRCPRPAAS